MKKLLLLAAVGLPLATAQAQTEKGSKLLGAGLGNASFAHSEYRNEFSITLYPTVGWFVVDKLAVGLSPYLGYQRSTFTYSGSRGSAKGSYIEVGLTPFARYYFLGSGQHRLFATASAGPQWYRSKYEDGGITPRTTSESTFLYDAGIGYNYFVVPTVALEATVRYRHLASYSFAASRNNDVFLGVGFQIFLPGKGAAVE